MGGRNKKQEEDMHVRKRLAIEQVLSGNLLKKNVADAVGVSDDTISRWLKDTKFAEEFYRAVQTYRSELVSRVKVKNPELLLKAQFKNEFSERVELTGKDGAALPTPILGGIINVQIDNGSSENKQLIEADKGSVGGDIGEQDDRDIAELN